MAQSKAADFGFMDLALNAARKAGAQGEVPVGAVIVRAQQVIATAGNEIIARRDPTAHAEILAIRAACTSLETERLIDCDLYVTLEPCPMCAGAISLSRLRRVYFAASDPKGGGVIHGARVFDRPTCHHRPEVYDGLAEREARDLLKAFFATRRG